MLPGAWYTCWGSMINWIKFDDTTTLEIVQKSFELKLIFRYFSGLVEWSMASHKLNKVSEFRSDSPACHIPKKDKKMLVNTFLTMTNFGQRYLCFAACHTLYNCVGYDPNNEFMILIYMNIISNFIAPTYPICCTPPIKFWSILTGGKKHRKSGRQKWGQSCFMSTPVLSIWSLWHMSQMCVSSLYLSKLEVQALKRWSLFCWSINARFLLLSLWFSDLAKCKNCQATYFPNIYWFVVTL